MGTVRWTKIYPTLPDSVLLASLLFEVAVDDAHLARAYSNRADLLERLRQALEAVQERELRGRSKRS